MGAFDIKYMPCISIKGQVLADLVAEFTESPVEVEVEEHRLEEKQVLAISLQGPSPYYMLMVRKIKGDPGWVW